MRPGRAARRTLISLQIASIANQPRLSLINEFHYDDISTDGNEFIEVARAAGTNSEYSIVL